MRQAWGVQKTFITFFFCVIYAFHLLLWDIKKTMMNKQVVLSHSDQEKICGMKEKTTQYTWML